MTERHRSIVDVHLVLRRSGRIVMLRRANTGYGDGMLHLPSGHLERGESVIEGIVREASEEIGVALEPTAIRCVHVMHRGAPGETDRVGFFFEADRWAGEPSNAEPGKCSELLWVDPATLPEDTIAYPAAGIRHIEAGVPFSVFGWSDTGI
ncbi:NUDIX domain-containing protein [Actinoplanes sp. NPDC051859]|uniref:NUDIX hydrolase n=1 Tax=Actinoplanes sp. NPDC051859 TaxID=3363909 RepID=UPI0037A66723